MLTPDWSVPAPAPLHEVLVDESADARLVSYLAGLGHDATLIART